MTATTVLPTLVRITLTSTNMNTAQLEKVLDLQPAVPGNNTERANRLANFIEGGLNRCYPQNLDLAVGCAPAVATLTVSSTGPVTTDTVVIANVTLTAGTDFATSATPATVATNIAAAINANATLNKIVVATHLNAVVTITALVAGVAGNGLALVDALTNVAAVAFAGGAEGDAFTINMK
jgi:hypothetical protein